MGFWRRPGAVLGSVMIGLLLATAVLSPAQEPAPDDGWVDLFNGQDLTGWQTTGEAQWTVEDGVLVGQQDDLKPGDIWTTDTYDNFALRVVFKVQWPANSGVWFRSLPEQGQMGYQFDILSMQEYGCTVGTIYAGGFLSQNKDESIVNFDDWNVAEIVADGPHIVATLNGHQVADINDTKFVTGRIGFQVHAGEQYKTMRIMVKECKLRRLAGGPQLGPFVDSNFNCFICHIDFEQEELTTTHIKSKIGCATCHGRSLDHEQDEEHLTAPDNMFEREQVIPFCDLCHQDRPKCPFKTPEDVAAAEQVCTDCHGQHSIPE